MARSFRPNENYDKTFYFVDWEIPRPHGFDNRLNDIHPEFGLQLRTIVVCLVKVSQLRASDQNENTI